MNDLLYAPTGTKLTYLDCNGYNRDVIFARKIGLIKGNQYTLSSVDVGDSMSFVYLEEFPTEQFNTVMFEADEYSEPTYRWMADYL